MFFLCKILMMPNTQLYVVVIPLPILPLAAAAIWWQHPQRCLHLWLEEIVKDCQLFLNICNQCKYWQYQFVQQRYILYNWFLPILWPNTPGADVQKIPLYPFVQSRHVQNVYSWHPPVCPESIPYCCAAPSVLLPEDQRRRWQCNRFCSNPAWRQSSELGYPG